MAILTNDYVSGDFEVNVSMQDLLAVLADLDLVGTVYPGVTSVSDLGNRQREWRHTETKVGTVSFQPVWTIEFTPSPEGLTWRSTQGKQQFFGTIRVSAGSSPTSCTVSMDVRVETTIPIPAFMAKQAAKIGQGKTKANMTEWMRGLCTAAERRSAKHASLASASATATSSSSPALVERSVNSAMAS